MIMRSMASIQMGGLPTVSLESASIENVNYRRCFVNNKSSMLKCRCIAQILVVCGGMLRFPCGSSETVPVGRPANVVFGPEKRRCITACSNRRRRGERVNVNNSNDPRGTNGVLLCGTCIIGGRKILRSAGFLVRASRPGGGGDDGNGEEYLSPDVRTEITKRGSETSLQKEPHFEAGFEGSRESQVAGINGLKDGGLAMEEGGSGGIDMAVGRALLFFVPLLWGLNGVVVRFILSQPGPPRPTIVVFLRKAFSVATFLFLLLLQRQQASSSSPSSHSAEASAQYVEKARSWVNDKAVWLAGAEIGLWTFMGTTCQTVGLEYTSATRGGFELQLKSILVPLMASFSGDEIAASTWAAAALALGGIVLLTFSSNLGGDGGGDHVDDDVMDVGGSAAMAEMMMADVADPVNTAAMCTGAMCLVDSSLLGDSAILAAAVFYALTTFRLGVHAKKVPAVQLSTANMTVALSLATLVMGADLHNILESGDSLDSVWEGWKEGKVLLAIFVSGVVCGAGATLAQAKGQSVVAPAEAQVLYSLQPMWAAGFASILLGEQIAPLGYVGGGIVLLATLLTAANKPK